MASLSYIRCVRLAASAFGIGGAFVAAIELLGRNQLAAPVPFLLLLPGMMTASLAPRSWDRISLWIVYGVDVCLYSGVTWLILRAIRRRSCVK